ncbi:glycosyltransferase [Pelosinus propionicus]|uniref:Tetratricopeptide repeat-containing protein n=1 Tax=Pelosinus propionicus DSM 13327 TaxID=1123291 RepID=A0A1I4HTA7_9FIRM|nr:glycosyltransferase [Pelosinus propionicus]SFL45429.1 Tetratricopeptide repeat-containing protein [Pelosinus propionicus DSM 13327]
MNKFTTHASRVVSAVVPVYNAAAYIRETIESLLRQEEPLGEIIIVDDGSSDNTCEIVEKVAATDSRLKLCRLPYNQGVSAARNFGIQVSNGEWILFLDGDDIADERLLIRQLSHVRQLSEEGYGDVILVHSAYQQIDEIGNKINGITRWKQVYPQEILGYFLLRNHIITTSGVLAYKKVLMQTGGFNPKLHYAEDWDLWLRLAQKGGFGYVDEPLVFVRRHSENTSKSVTTGLQGEQCVLNQYNIELIKTAIFRRDLPWEVNSADYAAMLFRLDKWEDGYHFLEQALGINAGFSTGHFLKGLYYVKNQEWLNARQSFEQTLMLDEQHGAALNNLGALLAAKMRTNEALYCLNRALEIFPGYLDAKRNIELLSNMNGKSLNYDELHFTWRELRPVLLAYSE